MSSIKKLSCTVDIAFSNWHKNELDVFICSRSVWFQAITATLLISAAPFFILFFIPLDNTAEKEWLLKIVLRLGHVKSV